MKRWVTTAGVCLLLTAAGGAAWLWLLPVEAFQRAALTRAGDDPYAQFEAAGAAEAFVWLGRWLLPVVTLAALLGLQRSTVIGAALHAAAREFFALTAPNTDSTPRTLGALRSWPLRILIVAWLGLFGVHLVDATRERAREWAYFRLRSGDDVLPNISFENRDVIRYLRQATPEHARIFAYSDQKLFFLSYYLRPRRIFMRMHPDAEYVIPQPGNARPLAAYRPGEVPEAEVRRLRPDFALEFFQGPDYVDPARLNADERWVAFWRESNRQSGTPPFLVTLRPFSAEGAP